jgi:structure-specific recognition protein 1
MNSVQSLDDDDEEGEISLAAQKEVKGPDGEPLSCASILCDTIKTRTETGTVSEAIVDFAELLCLTPRGRFQVSMHSSFLRLRGKSHDYKILYASIKRLFLLPKPDDLHWLFVVALDPPLRQGQTRYPHLVFQFEKEDEVDLEVNLSE